MGAVILLVLWVGTVYTIHNPNNEERRQAIEAQAEMDRISLDNDGGE